MLKAGRLRKKRGPWATCLPEKQFQSINTFAQSNDYATKLREKKLLSPF